MFETAVLQTVGSREGGRRFLTLPVSLAVHTGFIAVAIFAAVWNVSFPANTPPLLELFRPALEIPAGPPATIIRRGTPTPPEEKRPVAVVPNTPVTPSIEEEPAESLAPSLASGPTVSGDPRGTDQGDPDGTVNGDPSLVGPGGGPGTGGPFPITGNVKAPVILEKAAPAYPELARRIRKEGIAVVECIVDRRGAIRNVRAVYSDFPPFEAAAVEAVKRWRFLPGTLNGKPVDTIFQLTVRFTLR